MKNLQEVFVPTEMSLRAEDVSKYSRQELLAHLYVANLLGGEHGERINDFTVRDMRIESGRCVMRCLMKEDGKFGAGDVEGLKHARCDAELMNVQLGDTTGAEVVAEESSQMQVEVPLEILLAVEERCKLEIEMIERDVFKKTGRIIRDVEEEERRQGALANKPAANDDEEVLEEERIAA